MQEIRVRIAMGKAKGWSTQEWTDSFIAYVSEESWEGVRLYLDEGLVMDVNQLSSSRVNSKIQSSALHVALLNGHDQVCDLLLRRGALVDMLNSQGLAPMHLGRFHH